MKRTLATLLAAVLLTKCAHAAESFYAGAWWHVRIDHKDVLAKGAGAAWLALDVDGSARLVRQSGWTNTAFYVGGWAMNARGTIRVSLTNELGTWVYGEGDANTMHGTITARDAKSRWQMTHSTPPPQ